MNFKKLKYYKNFRSLFDRSIDHFRRSRGAALGRVGEEFNRCQDEDDVTEYRSPVNICQRREEGKND